MTAITSMDLNALFWKFVRERAAGSEILKHFPIRRRDFDRALGKTYGEYMVVDPAGLGAEEGPARQRRLNQLVSELVERHAGRFVDKARFEIAKAVTRDDYREAVASRSGPTLLLDEDDHYVDDAGHTQRFLPEGGVKVFAPNGRCGEYQVRDVLVMAVTGRCVHPSTGELLGDSPEMRVYQEDVGRIVLNVMVASEHAAAV